MNDKDPMPRNLKPFRDALKKGVLTMTDAQLFEMAEFAQSNRQRILEAGTDPFNEIPSNDAMWTFCARELVKRGLVPEVDPGKPS